MDRAHSDRSLLATGLLALAVSLPGAAQTLMRSQLIDDQVHLIGEDRAVLSAGETRTDIPCRVTPLRPRLGFDLQFQAGYRVSIPLQSLAGNGDKLRILFRIRPLNGEDEFYYFLDRYDVPKIAADAEGNAMLGGSYTLGPGRYGVDWLMRNTRDEVCADHWEIETRDIADIADLAGGATAYKAFSRNSDIFFEDPPVLRSASKSLSHVKVLVNFTPTDPRDVRLRSYDLRNLISILRAISRDPGFGVFGLTAFDMQQERVIFEQQASPRIDFPGLGEAVGTIEGGMVDIVQLADESSGSRFLASLLEQNLSPPDPQPDAVIILGPKLVLEQRVSLELPSRAESAGIPVFYFIYDATPGAYPWRDAISHALKPRRALEYSITFPKDLSTAMRGMLERVRGELPEPPRPGHGFQGIGGSHE